MDEIHEMVKQPDIYRKMILSKADLDEMVRNYTAQESTTQKTFQQYVCEAAALYILKRTGEGDKRVRVYIIPPTDDSEYLK